MKQPNRAKAGSKGRHLASINFTEELLEFVDTLAEEIDMNRSSLVCAIIEDFKKSGKTFKVEVVQVMKMVDVEVLQAVDR